MRTPHGSQRVASCVVGAPTTTPRTSSPNPCRGYVEGGHHLEKLQFALAVAQSRGDLNRSQELIQAIASLGGNAEEPGT
ncbi:hypothetical protein EVJ50_10295 [Synechococcus sp. RSCCF101]|nr:hypothetical protein EVJ50_10295 [Synechococcus sp. RSCCF101]